MTPLMYAILGVATALKLGLWAVCFTLRHQSGAALALAEDHINDVFSNAGERCGMSSTDRVTA